MLYNSSFDSFIHSFIPDNINTSTSVHVNKMENICSKVSAAKAPGHDNIAMHVKK